MNCKHVFASIRLERLPWELSIEATLLARGKSGRFWQGGSVWGLLPAVWALVLYAAKAP